MTVIVYVKNNSPGPLLCLSGLAPLNVPAGETVEVSVEKDTLTVFHTYGSHSDGEGVHIVLDTAFLFSGLEEGDTVELFREKTAVSTVKGVQGHIWYDRYFALCRVAELTARRHTVADEAALRSELKRSYRQELRWEILWEAIMDVAFELALEGAGAGLLFIMLWITYGFGRGLLIAAGGLLALCVFTIVFHFLWEYPRQRRRYKQLLAFLQPETVARFADGDW